VCVCVCVCVCARVCVYVCGCVFVQACVVATRLVLLPLLGMFWIVSLKGAEMVSRDIDPLIEFVALLQFSVPSGLTHVRIELNLCDATS